MEDNLKQKLDFILGRRSIRVFKPGQVSEEELRVLLEAAMAAPSAVGKDPWRFVVIRSRDTLVQIADVLPNGKMLPFASVGIVVCGDIEAAHDGQLSYMLQDCSAAVENLLVAVQAMGLGACWLGIHPREPRIKAVSKILGLPSTVIPVAALAIGHPGEEKEARTRYNPAFVHMERW